MNTLLEVLDPRPIDGQHQLHWDCIPCAAHEGPCLIYTKDPV